MPSSLQSVEHLKMPGIKRKYVDSNGVMHETWQEAKKAEFKIIQFRRDNEMISALEEIIETTTSVHSSKSSLIAAKTIVKLFELKRRKE